MGRWGSGLACFGRGRKITPSGRWCSVNLRKEMSRIPAYLLVMKIICKNSLNLRPWMSRLDHLRWIDPSDRCFMSNVLLFLIDSKTELPRPHRDDNLYICTCTQRKIWSVGDTEVLIRVWRETLTQIRQVVSLRCFIKLTHRAFSMALDS